jgi:hypothetical protein
MDPTVVGGRKRRKQRQKKVEVEEEVRILDKAWTPLLLRGWKRKREKSGSVNPTAVVVVAEKKERERKAEV